MATTGNLSQIRLESILSQLERKQFTGALLFRFRNIEKEYLWEKGIIVFTRSNDQQDFLGQFLLSQGIVTEEDLNTALQTQAETRVLLGRIFIMVGLVTEVEMESILLQKAAESLYDIFLWEAGTWDMDPRARPPRDIIRIDLKPGSLAEEGAKRRRQWKALRQAFPNRHVHFDVQWDSLPDQVKNDFQVSQYLELMEQGQSLRGISLETHRPDYRVACDLYELKQHGYITVIDDDGGDEEGDAKSQASADSGVQEPIAEAAQPTGVALRLSEAEDALMAGRYAKALEMYRDCLQEAPTSLEARLGVERTRAEFLESVREAVPLDKIPHLAIPMEKMMNLKLTPEEGYLISRVNGGWDFKSICAVSPLNDGDALLIFKRFIDEGWILIK